MSENKELLVDQLIGKYTESHNLSDLHIRSDQPLAIREHGQIVTFPDDIVSGHEINKFLKAHIDSYHSEKLENDMLSKGFQFSRTHSEFILMEQLVGQYLRFLHIVQTWNIRSILYFSARNLTFYASHTVKIKRLIHNS